MERRASSPVKNIAPKKRRTNEVLRPVILSEMRRSRTKSKERLPERSTRGLKRHFSHDSCGTDALVCPAERNSAAALTPPGSLPDTSPTQS
jgi:hypothetical protein